MVQGTLRAGWGAQLWEICADQSEYASLSGGSRSDTLITQYELKLAEDENTFDILSH